MSELGANNSTAAGRCGRLRAAASLILAAWAWGHVLGGRLEVCPQHPYYFRWGGRHLVLVGVSDRALFFLWRNAKGFSPDAYLEDIAAGGLNYVRQDFCAWGGLLAPVEYPGQFSQPAWPFARTGPGTAVDGRPRFDLTRFEDSYFEQRIKPFCRRAERLGIVVELTLFEGFRSRRAFEQSLYAPANNVNGLALEPGRMTGDAALGHPRLLAIQQRYVDKVLEATAAFGNVIYEIANEAGSRRWVAHFVDYIHNHRGHPAAVVSAGEQSSSFDPRTGGNDVVVKHRGRAGPYASDQDLANHRRALLGLRAGKPVTHNEYFLYANRSTDDVNFVRKMMWADFTAGGHSNFFDFTFWRGTGRTVGDGLPSRSPPDEITDAGRFLLDFVRRNRVPFWKMSPKDEAASAAGPASVQIFTFAEPGRRYICYILGRSVVTVTVQLPPGEFAARWYDPKGGRYLGPAESADGDGAREFRSPAFEQDVVLYVWAASGDDAAATGDAN